ncbi:DUF397 domain-containing protein [Streptomycetaceae bacterium NBC_01309]
MNHTESDWRKSSYSTGEGGACVETSWRKSTYSSNEGGACVETSSHLLHNIAVRDSKDTSVPHLEFPYAAWASLTTDLKRAH